MDGNVLMLRCKQFSQSPDVVGQASLHCRGTAKCLVYPSEVVIREVQSARCFQVVQFFRERIRQSRESSDRLTNCHVLSFDVASADVARVGTPVAYLNYCLYHWRGRILSSRVVLPVIAIQLYHLSKVSLSRENVLNSLAVKVKPVCSDLEAVFWRDAISQTCKELVGGFTIALSNSVGGNQFRFSIKRNEYPSIPNFRRILSVYVTLLLLAVCPNFVGLNPLALEILHRAFEQLYAAFSSENKQPHDRVAVQSCNSLRAANASAFNQKLDR